MVEAGPCLARTCNVTFPAWQVAAGDCGEGRAGIQARVLIVPINTGLHSVDVYALGAFPARGRRPRHRWKDDGGQDAMMAATVMSSMSIKPRCPFRFQIQFVPFNGITSWLNATFYFSVPTPHHWDTWPGCDPVGHRRFMSLRAVCPYQ